jgi:hypothetical protein
LKVSSNFRRLLTDDVLIDLIIYDFPRFSRQFGATSGAGHMVIAAEAWRELSPAQKAAVTLLKVASRLFKVAVLIFK